MTRRARTDARPHQATTFELCEQYLEGVHGDSRIKRLAWKVVPWGRLGLERQQRRQAERARTAARQLASSFDGVLREALVRAGCTEESATVVLASTWIDLARMVDARTDPQMVPVLLWRAFYNRLEPDQRQRVEVLHAKFLLRALVDETPPSPARGVLLSVAYGGLRTATGRLQPEQLDEVLLAELDSSYQSLSMILGQYSTNRLEELTDGALSIVGRDPSEIAALLDQAFFPD